MSKHILGLTSKEDGVVSKALKTIHDKGTQASIRPLLEAFAARKDDALREEMLGMLSSMKLSAAEDIFLEALTDPKLAHVAGEILQCLWSCGFTCDGRLALVVEVACQGDFKQAMEGATLLEQVETVQDEKDLLEAQVIVGEAMGDDSRKGIAPFLEGMKAHLAMLQDTLM